MFKVKKDQSPEIVTEIFLKQAQTQYYLRYHNDFRTCAILSHCPESTLFLGFKIWDFMGGGGWGVGGDPNDTMRWKVSSEKLRVVEFASCFLETLDSSGTSLKDKF